MPNGICIDSLNDEILAVMRKANFYSFAVGVESGSQRILKSMRKAVDLNTIENKISMAKRKGFYVTGFFIIGYPGETIDDINASIECAIKLKIDKVAFSKYTPLPGTEVYDDLIRNGELSQWLHFEGMSARDIPYSPKGISKDELRKYIKKAVRKFYLRPSVILRHIFSLNVLTNIKTLFKLAKEFMVFSFI